MKRRVLGALLSIFLISASATATYAAFSTLQYGLAIDLPLSVFSLDIFDDLADSGYPGGVANRAVREKAPIKLPLGFKARLAKFNSQALRIPQIFAQPFSSQQELYRYQEVFRI